MDHACFSGRDCLLLDLNQQAPIRDLYVIEKVKKCSKLILLQKVQISCYQSSFKIGTFIKASVSKRNLITSNSFKELKKIKLDFRCKIYTAVEHSFKFITSCDNARTEQLFVLLYPLYFICFSLGQNKRS